MKNKPAAKSNPKLTKTYVEALKPKEKEFIVWDSELQGFGVRVFPSGQKIFVCDYHIQGQRRPGRQGKDAIGYQRRRMGLGSFSFGHITVDQAREAARQILANAALGKDVLEERREAQQTMTLSEFWPQFLEVAQLRWKPSTRTLFEYVWGHCLEPGLGKMRLDRIRPGHITHWQSAQKDAPGQANIAFRLLKAMLNHAIRLELIEKNPTNAVKPFREAKRERFLSSEETKRLFDAIAAEEAAGGIKSTTRTGQSTGRGGRGKKEAESRGITPFQAGLFRLLALTGARLSEISTCEWAWIDRERRVIRLPDSKTGQKTVWLSSKALEEIERLWNLRTQDRYLIEGDKPGTHLVNAQKPWRRVRERAGLLDITIHTLRHNFASHGVMGSIGLSIVGAALGHRDTRTTSRYAHLADNPVAEAVELISGKIVDAARNGGARVLPIEEKRAEGAGQ